MSARLAIGPLMRDWSVAKGAEIRNRLTAVMNLYLTVPVDEILEKAE